MDTIKLDGLVSLINKAPALRRIIFPGPSVALCSMGGVGSTALARHIGSIADKTPREHAYSPEVYNDEKQVKLGYVFGNPYNSVLSVFRRGYQGMHANAMNDNSPTTAPELKGVSLEQYLAGGEDAFHLDRQLSNWADPAKTRHPVMLIKYEALAENIDEVLAFFDCNKPFKVKQRKSAWQSQPQPIIDGLEAMYGGFAKKIESMPDILIINPSRIRETEAEVQHG
ncbi:hypothetical protein [Alteromonas confluentis]|uniref:Sulfotransferase family protein n=1 Tax=Alteromonas confluentis TaxID=1656094 RepID=A0A1E7ZC06_9ALTE|nr:hypothetical protein [Alteromonas confluentis]OFC71055.1 hypothetical protein BFC18_10090 [Alteromonas confluentis]